MRLPAALAKLKRHPRTHLMWRPGLLCAYLYDPSFDPTGLSCWYMSSHLKGLRAEGLLHQVVGGFGFGVQIFSCHDLMSNEWVVTTVKVAQEAGYTDDIHDPLTCSECARERRAGVIRIQN